MTYLILNNTELTLNRIPNWRGVYLPIYGLDILQMLMALSELCK